MPKPIKPLYKTLGLENENASKDEIRKAYKKLALKLHPDKDKTDGAKERFEALSNAYEILFDENTRKSYDKGEIDEKGEQVQTLPTYPQRRQASSPPDLSTPTAAPSTTPHATLKQAGKDKGIYLDLLVPIKSIINEFNTFKKEKLDEKNSQGGPKYPENSFTHEKIDGPPTVHIFTFPDEASMNQFLKQILSKNMVKYSNNIQELPDSKQSAQQKIKESVENLRSGEPSANEEPYKSPTPFDRF